ncbi:hypothetical protein [Aquimarina sp. MMG016]|uniref:hypothetical protein n=1 Tax=Aquimarina sp. MMG016 TaxID=2822690 RepID=UPI001B3A3812|nr:hypothetical protein [Aquimarina sp. MMG016]MBQ4820085.1 hypothetical protein [Aquimarina sp. MMG016]
MIKLFTGIFVTKIFIPGEIFSKRLELIGSEFNSGIFGVISAILFPFSVITMLIVIYHFRNFSKTFIVFAILFGLYPFLETFYLGGRTIIVLLGTTIIFTLLASIEKNVNYKKTIIKLATFKLITLPSFFLRKKVLIISSIILIAFVSYSIKVINDRLSRFNYKDTLSVWEVYHRVKVDDEFKKEVRISSIEDKNYKIGIYSLKHYFVHGVFEYIRLVNHLDKTTGYYYGLYEFYVFAKFFKVFGVQIPSFYDLNSISHKRAVYTTFWGPFYIDFGIFGIIIMFLWGRFVRKVHIRALQGNVQYVILFSFLATIILASFYINFLLGTASYYLFAFLVAIILFKIWPNNLTFVLHKTNNV